MIRFKQQSILFKHRPSFAIIDKGRTNDERSYIWVENGRFYGMGYIDSEVIINDLSQRTYHALQNEPVHHAINFFLYRYPRKVHLHKNNQTYIVQVLIPIKEM
jgi:DNA polymerase-3 subunit epsilon